MISREKPVSKRMNQPTHYMEAVSVAFFGILFLRCGWLRFRLRCLLHVEAVNAAGSGCLLLLCGCLPFRFRLRCLLGRLLYFLWCCWCWRSWRSWCSSLRFFSPFVHKGRAQEFL